MNAIADILTESAGINRSAPEESRADFEKIPAKTAAYLLEGENGEPILLATVGDLRAALKRRLADTPAEAKTKRVEYAKISARVRYVIVHSPFAANWAYFRAAKRLFPKSYRQMISWRGAHYIAINSKAKYPQFQRTEKIDDGDWLYFGPVAQRSAAEKLIETLQDLFDLCRYHHILVQAPNAKACAYKEMGKCPAPCDGTIPMEAYYKQLTDAIAFISTPPGGLSARVGYMRWRGAQEEAMKAAAAKLAFEAAGKIKQSLARAAIIEQPSFERMDGLSRFAYLALQPGPGKPFIEPFLIHGGTITALPAINKRQLAAGCAELFRRTKELAEIPVRAPLLDEQIETMSLVAHHLFRGEADAGIYLPMHYVVDAGAIEKAATELLERKSAPKPMAEQSSEKEPETTE
jgi:excinuclease UvrABC nuclease subunit